MSEYILDEVNSIPGVCFILRLPARSNRAKPGLLLNPGEFIMHENAVASIASSLFFSQPMYSPL